MTAEAPDFTGHLLAANPLAVRVEKQAVEVNVLWAKADGVLQTREGAVHYRAGDALLHDDAGYHWPVQRDRFGARYRALAPTVDGEDGRYIARHQIAHARRMEERFSVRVGHARDLLQGAPGDWLLHYFDGSYGVVAGEVFNRTYAIEGQTSE